jgi:hypothetical protein
MCYIDQFSCGEWSAHFRNKSHWIILYIILNMLLNLSFQYV